MLSLLCHNTLIRSSYFLLNANVGGGAHTGAFLLVVKFCMQNLPR